jgi:hypothetical protein
MSTANDLKKIELREDIQTAELQIADGKGVDHSAARNLLRERLADEDRLPPILPPDEIDHAD